MTGIRGVTLDFYETLAYHATGRGRGASFVDYLASQELASAPWEHQVLYDVFEFYGEAYPEGPEREPRQRFWIEFTRRLFARMRVIGAGSERPETHAAAVRRLMGPESLRLFDDALPTLGWLRRQGIPAGVVSNWQCGLARFCRELGLSEHVDFVLASAEVGCAKPDRGIFELAAHRMGLPPHAVVHVGDHPLEDARGAENAGFRPVLLSRGGVAGSDTTPVISGLWELEALIRPGD